jgi:hypothetical protein
MTLSTQTSKTSFAGNGVSTAFPLPFPFARDADIKALLLDGDLETPLTQGTHYTLSGAGSASGGSLSMLVPPATSQTLVIWRSPAIVQETDYVENSVFPAEAHEQALDLLTMICQSLQEQIDRAVLYPVSTPAEDILDSTDFLSVTTAGKTAAQSAQAASEAARDAAQGHAEAAAVSAGSASTSASAAAQSALAAAEIASGSIPDATISVKGKVLLASDGGTTASTVVQATDTRLSNSRKCDNTFDSAGTARGNLGAAASGANSDITSLSGLTTALSIAQGGTGATTAAAARTNLGITDGLPAGSVIAVATETIPTGFLECNGAAVSRSTYAGLYAAIGVVHGYGDNATTFNLPDYRGRFLRGWDHAIARDPDRASRTAMNTGGQTGDHVGSVQADAFKSHKHTHGMPAGSFGSGSGGVINENGGDTDYAGGNETRPLNAGVMYCIKY